MTASVTIVNTSNWDEPIRGRIGQTHFTLKRGQSIPIGLEAETAVGAEFQPMPFETSGYLGELEVEVHGAPEVGTAVPEVGTAKHVETIGEFRVGIGFNPSGDERVIAIKRAAADLIDECERQRMARNAELRDHDSDRLYNPASLEPVHSTYDPGLEDQVGEVNRLYREAQSLIETAAMHAVKAATKRKRGES